MNSRPAGRPRLYDAQWRQESNAWLKIHKFCEYCLQRGKQRRSSIVDHVIPHRGDKTLFWQRSNWSAKCKSCHDSAKQAEEKLGRLIGCDQNGVPLDPSHHWTGAPFVPIDPEYFPPEVLWPKGLRPSALPLTLVCGPPASGKSTYVNQHAAKDDVVIDLDLIVAGMCGRSREPDRVIRLAALRERNRMLTSLSSDESSRSAWFIVGAPQRATREQWARMLKPQAVLVMPTPMDVCLERVIKDRDRRQARDEQGKAIARWWKNYTPSPLDSIVSGHQESAHKERATFVCA